MISETKQMLRGGLDTVKITLIFHKEKDAKKGRLAGEFQPHCPCYFPLLGFARLTYTYFQIL